MGGRKGVKSEGLRLQCEWNNCGAVYSELGDFYQHLQFHFYTEISTVHTEGFDLKCHWNECSYVTLDQNDILRHIYFHGYHTKVKWWGLLCHQENGGKLGECKALHNRNLIPELPDGFKCEWKDCDMIFDIPDEFYLHVGEHAFSVEGDYLPNKQLSFACGWEDCNYVYETTKTSKKSIGKFKLRDHLKTHTKERSFACPWCGNLYATKTKFSDHLIRQIDARDHCFQCTHCLRTFASERLLKDHMRHHVNHYKCPKCEMTCPNPAAIKHHIRYKHSDERPFSCTFCEYKAKTMYDLNVHMTFHQSDLAYKCHVSGCEYVVRSLQNLRFHFRMKHLKDRGNCYACHLCDKRFSIGYKLTHHLRSTHSFHWPPGHTRFKYKECNDHLFRLQTFRFESVELTEQLLVNDQSLNRDVEQSITDSNQGAPKRKTKTKRSKPVYTAEKRITRSAALKMKKSKKTSKQAVSEGLELTQAATQPCRSSPTKRRNASPNSKRKKPVPENHTHSEEPRPNQAEENAVKTDPAEFDLDNGTLARDDKGQPVKVQVDGSWFYVIKGNEEGNSESVSYCLISAEQYLSV